MESVNVNLEAARRIFEAHCEAEEALDMAYKILAAARAEAGRLQKLYNIAKRRRDQARGKWLDLADTMDVRAQVGLNVAYLRRKGMLSTVRILAVVCFALCGLGALRAEEHPLPNPEVLTWQFQAQERERAINRRIEYQQPRQPERAAAIDRQECRRLSPAEVQELMDALERYFRENAGRIPVFRP